MSFELSKDQVKFMNATGNVLLSASAGSGKTSTMVEKLVKLIEEDVCVNEMLIITFTNAAANDMRQKLFSKLIDKVQPNPNLSNQIDMLQTSDIGTLHSICKRIITKYFYAISLEPGFVILEDKTCKYMLNKVINNTLDELIDTHNEAFNNLCLCYFDSRNMKKLKGIITDIYYFMNSLEDADSWSKMVLTECYNEDEKHNKCINFVLDYFKQLLAFQLSYFNKLKDMASNMSSTKVIDFLDSRIVVINELLEANDINVFSKIVQNANDTFSSVRKPSTKISELAKNPEYSQMLSDVNESFKKDVWNKIDDTFSNYSLDKLIQTKKNVVTLLDIVKQVTLKYSETKKEAGGIDFNDLEHFCLQVLQNDDIAHELQSKYKYVFVDEYQDINPIQNAIIKKLSNGNNLNMIGDVKQSIYEFRQASPQIFVDTFNSFSNSDNGSVINLNTNYRSKNNILQFVNSIFNKIMTTSTLGFDYKTNSQLNSTTDLSNDKSCVKMCIIQRDSAKNQTDEECVVCDKNEIEANVICSQIANLYGKQYTTLKGEIKTYKYSDFMVLLRSKDDLANKVYSALMQANIPVGSEYKYEIFDTNEIITLHSLLKVVDNDYNDIAIATLLLCPLYLLNENDLVNIKTYANITLKENYYSKNIKIDRNDEKMSFYYWVKQYSLCGQDNVLKQKLVKFYNDINEYRFYLLDHTITELLQYVLYDKGLYNYYFSMPDGLEKISNINKFLELINTDMEHNLIGLLDYFDNISEDKIELKIVPPSDEAVKIMTLHVSKGLEKPVVILGGICNMLNKTKDTELSISLNYGIGLKNIDYKEKSISQSVVKSASLLETQRKETNEEIRLLYVALTRAISKLVLVGTTDLNNVKSSERTSINNAKSYFDFIVKSLDTNDLAVLQNNSILTYTLHSGEDCSFEFERITNANDYSNASVNVRMPIITNGDSETVAKLQQLYGFRYPKHNQGMIALKNSVTSILKEENDYENTISKIDNLSVLDTLDNVDSMALGTAYHSVMQNVDFSKNYSNVALLELIDNSPNEEALKKLIDPTKIGNAITTIKLLIREGDIVKKEKQFLMQEDHSKLVKNGQQNQKVIVQGVVDLMIENENGVTLIDYKTNKIKDSQLLIKEYSTQLNLYAHAIELALNKPVKNKYIYSFETNKLIKL